MSDLFTLATIAPLIVLAPYMGRLFKMPVAVLEILLGALGVYFGLIKPNHSFSMMAEVGFLFLMFLCGMEVDLYMFKQIKKAVLKRIFGYFAILYITSTLIVLGLHLPALYIIALPIVSLGMIMTLVRDYGKEPPWLDLVLKVGVLGELTSIVLLVVVDGIYLHGLSMNLYRALSVLLVFLLAIASLIKICGILFWWFPGLKAWIMPSNEANQDIRFTLTLFFILVGIVAWLKLEMVLGAFLAGTLVSTFFPHKHELFDKLNDIGFGFFVPLFFIHVGSTLNLHFVLGNYTIITHACLVMVAMLYLHLSTSFLLFRTYFNSGKNTVLFALSASMPLTFLVTTASVGLRVGAINQDTYYAFLLAAIFEGILFTTIIKMLQKQPLR
ncbi:cation:proton antiporter [Helicobacter suis]|uniref:cation:proton antiporter n=1 Tax=Helicobacter suis TaxID=104628 RepID=UPI0015967280|nr:cation:proton antiporter [Helicobacter suis]BCD51361.1 Sodium/Proton antiporter NapA [Helicobacter suis]